MNETSYSSNRVWIVALTLLTMVAATPVLGIGDILEAHRPLPDFDTRVVEVAPSPSQLATVDQLGASASWNRFGTPRSLIRHDGSLASGYGLEPATAARDWLRDQAALFRLSPLGVDELELVNVSPFGRDETAAVLFRQSFGGLAAASGGLITVGVDRGEILYASSSSVGEHAPPGEAVLSAVDAWLLAALGVDRPLTLLDLSGIHEDSGWTVFEAAGFSHPQRARLRAFPTPETGVLPAFETIVLDVAGGAATAYTIFVDAQTGELLARYNRVQRLHDSEGEKMLGIFPEPSWSLFLATPTLAVPADDTRTLTCWTFDSGPVFPVDGCELELANGAAPAPWDEDPRLGIPTATTFGNAASTASAWGSPLTPGDNYRPIDTERSYQFEWLDTWQSSGCSPNVFTPPGATNANDLDAAVVNLFGMHNRMHDWSYHLGFTERNYNLQLDNFGRTSSEAENDPEVGNVQAGAVTGGAPSYLGRDNANQITLNDGIPGISNMYLWQPIAAAFYSPCVDGNYDMGVIGHEYGHAISNRMAGGPDDGLTGAQAGAMGESWSDLIAMEYLNEHGLVPTAGESPYAVGTYATGSTEKGIRNYNMSRNLLPPTVLAGSLTQSNPLNYSNIGYDLTGVQVHADGEIWSATNFDLRSALMAALDAELPADDTDLQRRCANGEEKVDLCPGNRRWAQLMFDAWLLMPPSVSMLDARDAFLAANQMRFEGAHQRAIWRAFARRGMGSGAASRGSDDGDPVPSFASPLEEETTLQFVVEDAVDGTPIEAEVYVGHYEARSVPIADTVSGSALGDSADFVTGGILDFVVRADGYGHSRFPWNLGKGTEGTIQVVKVRMARNLASTHSGASIEGDGINHQSLIDDTEATNWASLEGPVNGDRVTVDLADGIQRVIRVNVSAMLRPEDPDDADSAAQNRFTALRQFEILVCVEGADAANPTCSNSVTAGFTSIFVSPADAFPGAAPRPVAPDLILREFDVPDSVATHVQLRVLESQCTGGPAFQGEQDADTLNPTDCDLSSSEGDRVRAAELQVFSVETKVP